MELLPRLDPEETKRLDRAHVFHSWSAQDLIDPPVVVSARGSRFTDDSGREYLDFASQLVNVNLGHSTPSSSRRSPRRPVGWRRWRPASPSRRARRPRR